MNQQENLPNDVQETEPKKQNKIVKWFKRVIYWLCHIFNGHKNPN